MTALSIISGLFIVEIAISNTNSNVVPNGGGEASNLGGDLRETTKSKETKTRNLRRKPQRNKEKRITIQKMKKNYVKTKAGENKFGHCDYVDLVEVGYREGSNCGPGKKFLFKVV